VSQERFDLGLGVGMFDFMKANVTFRPMDIGVFGANRKVLHAGRVPDKFDQFYAPCSAKKGAKTWIRGDMRGNDWSVNSHDNASSDETDERCSMSRHQRRVASSAVNWPT
jgi:hypothetical protein